MKIMIIYASAGEGHKKAAEALYKAAKEHNSSYDISFVDALDYTTVFFKWSYSKGYLFLVKCLPTIWSFFYHLFDIKPIYVFISRIRRVVNAIHASGLEALLIKEKPRLILTTHFLPNEVISSLKKRKLLNTIVISCITDFKLHAFWVCDGVDFYNVACPDTKDDLIKWDVKDKAINVFGIPVDPKFAILLKKEDIARLLGIEPNIFCALIVGGGFGVGPIEKLVEVIDKELDNIQLLVICGHNKRLYGRLKDFSSYSKNTIKVFEFVDNMYQLMGVSDIMLTKTGGLTCMEALAKGLFIIALKPIPGQEMRNCQLLVKYGVCIKTNTVKEAKEALKRLYQDPAAVKQAKRNIAMLSRPNSSKDIIEFAFKFINETRNC